MPLLHPGDTSPGLTLTVPGEQTVLLPASFSADARVIADLTGAFVNPGPVYLQSTGFAPGPQGKVVVSVHSSGAIGRLVPEDVAGLVRYLRGHASASAWQAGISY